MWRCVAAPLPALLLFLAAAAAADDAGPSGADAAAPTASDGDVPAALLTELPPPAAPAYPDDEDAFNDFLRQGRAGRDNFLRFGRAGKDNFMRFGKAGRDNFMRFGRAGKDNFMRFGKAGRDNFMRFGRASRENFIRFGKAYRDNFMRFGRAGKDNFMRFGRDGEDNDDGGEFPREIRDRAPSNFLRFGRDGDASPDHAAVLAALMGVRDAADAAEEMAREERGGKSTSFIRLGRDRNFLRFGRARPDNFLRLGRDPAEDPEPTAPEPPAAGNEEQAQEVHTDPNDVMERTRRAKTKSLFGRWKMSDLNFIRLGRSAPQGELAPAPAKRSIRVRASRSDARRPPRVDNFIRLGNGKRGDAGDGDGDAAGRRAKRAAADCDDPASTLFADLPLAPLSYYSPLAVGLPNYLFAPEMSLLPRDGDAPRAPVKRVSSGGGSNFIRLG